MFQAAGRTTQAEHAFDHRVDGALVLGLSVVLMAALGEPSEQLLLQAYQDLPSLTKPVFRDKRAETLERLLGPPESERGNLSSMGKRRTRRRLSGSHQR